MRPSGKDWCTEFPGSNRVEDLDRDFSNKVAAFINAVTAAGAVTHISATYRPPERAYLMHFACKVAGYTDAGGMFHQIDPAKVDAMQGVEIDWTCGNSNVKARAAAKEMVTGYGIAFPAALVSNHTRRKAIDMTISWKGTIHVRNKAGVLMPATFRSAEGARDTADLWPVGASYGVIKLPTDHPHWSFDGH